MILSSCEKLDIFKAIIKIFKQAECPGLRHWLAMGSNLFFNNYYAAIVLCVASVEGF